jgi:hypothetical protein
MPASDRDIYGMKFIRHIFSGSTLLLTLVFNFIFGFFFYEVFFDPNSFYEGMMGPGIAVAVAIYSMYWAYCIKTYKDSQA